MKTKKVFTLLAVWGCLLAIMMCMAGNASAADTPPDPVQFSVRFVDADKQPVAGYPVNAIDKSGAVHATFYTNADGTVTGSLPVKAKFTLRLLNYDGQCIIFDKSFKTGSKPVDLGDIVVKSPKARTAVVKGAVVQDGKPIANGTLTYVMDAKRYTVAIVNGKYEFKVYFCDAKPQISLTAANSTGDAVSETRTAELGKGNNKIKKLELIAKADEEVRRPADLADNSGDNNVDMPHQRYHKIKERCMSTMNPAGYMY